MTPVCVHGCICVFVFQCKLEQQACLTGKDLTLKCSGLCPCATAAPTSMESKRGKIDIFNMNLQQCKASNLFYSVCLSHTTMMINTWKGARNIRLCISFWPPQRAVPDRIWLISGSVWGTGSSFCKAMPSRTTIARLGPEPLQPAPHQVRATI